ncbi:hypothetical protein CRUP_003839 [Coryphaenoides rupestris]|nr:hypothetical protein CRUP_003839 [Coryphaenoides rupestris]
MCRSLVPDDKLHPNILESTCERLNLYCRHFHHLSDAPGLQTHHVVKLVKDERDAHHRHPMTHHVVKLVKDERDAQHRHPMVDGLINAIGVSKPPSEADVQTLQRSPRISPGPGSQKEFPET